MPQDCYILHKSRKAKNDEFYTLYEDVEKECKHYKEHYKDKVIFCNCDDYRVSNFYKYFKDNFNEFGLKKLYAVGYQENGNGIYCEYDGTSEIAKNLNGDGSFYSDESLDVLNKSDIVVTNPPFSKMLQFYNVIKDKKFLFMAPLTLLSYVWFSKECRCKDIFYGYNKNNSKKFYNGTELSQLSNILYFQNLQYFECKYTPTRYIVEIDDKRILLDDGTELLHYDNYDAYECKYVKNIPSNLPDGVKLGVSLNVFRYCTKENFDYIMTNIMGCKTFQINGKTVFARLIIDNRILK